MQVLFTDEKDIQSFEKYSDWLTDLLNNFFLLNKCFLKAILALKLTLNEAMHNAI